MKNLICFHRTQVLYKSEITDLAERFSSIRLIIKLQTSVFKKLYLVNY